MSSVQILDGALGTVLEDRGHTINDGKLWSTAFLKTNPDALIQVHRDYIAAGANIISTASYQFDFDNFLEIGVDYQEATELLQSSIKLVRAAIGTEENIKVAASLGTYGAVLADGSEYSGKLGKSENELYEFHLRRTRAMLANSNTKPDYLAFETIPCISEVKAISRVLETLDCSIPSWISLTCKDDRCLNSGESIEDAINEIAASKATLCGFNCLSPIHVSGILQLLEKTKFPKQVVLYPNRGESYIDREWVESSGTPDDELAQLSLKWISTNRVSVIGGCCRTSPVFISKLAKLIQKAT